MHTIHEHPVQEAGHGTLHVQDVAWARVLALFSCFFSLWLLSPFLSSQIGPKLINNRKDCASSNCYTLRDLQLTSPSSYNIIKGGVGQLK